MTDHVLDYDWQSVYPSIVKPMCGRGSGKSQAQLQMYDAILKGENKMNVKETLNQIHAATTNGVIKDSIEIAKNFDELLNKPEEEYIWVKGFKGTDKDMRCQDDYQYELGKQFDLDADIEPVVCSKGFHFCKELKSVFRHYKIGDGNRFFEVEALVKKSDIEPKKSDTVRADFDPWSKMYRSFDLYEDKYAAKSIRFIRELTVDEVFESVTDSDTQEWDKTQKKRAMETSIAAVRADIRVFELCAAGYSPAFSKYIAGDTDRYKTAMAMASLTDVSMDVKVMAIFMDNQDE